MGEQQAQVRFLTALIRNWRTALAFRLLRSAARTKPGYAFAWHCKVARVAREAGVDYATADQVGRLFCRRAFGVDTTGG